MIKIIISVIIGFALARITSVISNSLRASGSHNAAFVVDILPIVIVVVIISVVRMRQRSENF